MCQGHFKTQRLAERCALSILSCSLWNWYGSDHVPIEHRSGVAVGPEAHPERQHGHVVLEEEEVLFIRVRGDVVGNALIWNRRLIEAEGELGLSTPPRDVTKRVSQAAEWIGELPGLGDAVVRIGGENIVKERGARAEKAGDDHGTLDVDFIELGMTLGKVDDAKPVA